MACRPLVGCPARAICVTPSDRKRSRAGRCYFYAASASGGATGEGATGGSSLTGATSSLPPRMCRRRPRRPRRHHHHPPPPSPSTALALAAPLSPPRSRRHALAALPSPPAAAAAVVATTALPWSPQPLSPPSLSPPLRAQSSIRRARQRQFACRRQHPPLSERVQEFSAFDRPRFGVVQRVFFNETRVMCPQNPKNFLASRGGRSRYRAN